MPVAVFPVKVRVLPEAKARDAVQMAPPSAALLPPNSWSALKTTAALPGIWRAPPFSVARFAEKALPLKVARDPEESLRATAPPFLAVLFSNRTPAGNSTSAPSR